MNERQEQAFSRLLAAWRRHDDARSLTLHELGDARVALDHARDEMWSLQPFRPR